MCKSSNGCNIRKLSELKSKTYLYMFIEIQTEINLMYCKTRRFVYLHVQFNPINCITGASPLKHACIL